MHVFAVCQPSVPVLAAVSLMEEDDDPHVPLSVTMAGGPIDTRVSPTVVNRLAETRGTDWFRNNVTTVVPWPNPGFGRAVYPGFLQLSGFMTMNLDRHLEAHKELFLHLVRGDGDSAEKHREFYDEYLAVMDLTAEFYLQTVDQVFVRHTLPKGEFKHRGRFVDPGRIRRVAIMTVEGEKDDITGTGQCRAALELCRGVPDTRKMHYECPKVGHYGVFNGSRFRSSIAPRMAAFMRRHDPRGEEYFPVSGLEMGGIDIEEPAPAPARLPVTRRSAGRGVTDHAAGDTQLDAHIDDASGISPMLSTLPFALFGMLGGLMLESVTSLQQDRAWGAIGTLGT